MTRLLYLPDDATLVQLDVDITAHQLAAAINAGLRPIPILDATAEPLLASQIGNTVVVCPKSRRGHTPRHLEDTGLTKRQLEVLELASRGYSNYEIAHVMGISRRTVSYHLKAIKERIHPDPPVKNVDVDD